jgi:hypothetical protein
MASGHGLVWLPCLTTGVQSGSYLSDSALADNGKYRRHKNHGVEKKEQLNG